MSSSTHQRAHRRRRRRPGARPAARRRASSRPTCPRPSPSRAARHHRAGSLGAAAQRRRGRPRLRDGRRPRPGRAPGPPPRRPRGRAGLPRAARRRPGGRDRDRRPRRGRPRRPLGAAGHPGGRDRTHREARPTSSPSCRRAAARAPRVFTVCSPTGGCGKTFYASNLAYLLATTSDLDVALVDLDLQFGEVTAAMRVRSPHSIADAVAVDDPRELDRAAARPAGGARVGCAGAAGAPRPRLGRQRSSRPTSPASSTR